MPNVVKPERWWTERQPPDPPEPPMDLSARIGKLETFAEKATDRLTTIEKDVAVVRSNYATKADVSDAKNSIIAWLIASMFGIAGLALGAAKLFLVP